MLFLILITKPVNIIFKLFLFVVVFMLPFFCRAERNCSINSFGSFNIEKSFDTAKILKPYKLDLIGVVEGEGNCFLVNYVEKEFGNRRLTKFLIIVPLLGDYFGQYSIPERPSGVNNGGVYFFLENGKVNTVDLKLSELPSKIYIDAELYDVMLHRKVINSG